MASRFIATRECDVHDNIKQEILRRQEHETVLFCKSIGLQGRALKNRVIQEAISIEERGGGLDELIPLLAGQRIRDAWELTLDDGKPMRGTRLATFVERVETFPMQTRRRFREPPHGRELKPRCLQRSASSPIPSQVGRGSQGCADEF